MIPEALVLCVTASPPVRKECHLGSRNRSCGRNQSTQGHHPGHWRLRTRQHDREGVCVTLWVAAKG